MLFSPTNVADAAAYRGPGACSRISNDDSDSDGDCDDDSDLAKSKDIGERYAADAERLLEAGVDAKIMSALYSSWFSSAANTARDASPRLIAFLLARKLGYHAALALPDEMLDGASTDIAAWLGLTRAAEGDGAGCYLSQWRVLLSAAARACRRAVDAGDDKLGRLANALEERLLNDGDCIIFMNYFGLTMRDMLLRIKEENKSTQFVGMLARALEKEEAAHSVFVSLS